jgi:integrase
LAAFYLGPTPVYYLEINTFLDAEIDMKYGTLFRLSIFCGARRGELLGLKWTDVDRENTIFETNVAKR